MQAKTKSQKLVYGISQELPKMETELKKWSFEKVIEHKAFRNKSQTACLSCGHTWKPILQTATEKCPSCKRTLSVENTRVKVHYQRTYFAVLDVVDDYQIVRHFQITMNGKAGEKPSFWFWEIIQQYILIGGKSEVIARNRGGMGQWNSENFHGDLEIRDRRLMDTKFDAYPKMIYPRKLKVLPIYQRNGFNGFNHGYSSPLSLLKNLLIDSKTETLLKAKQYDLLDERVSDRWNKIDRYWDSVKICIRNGYIVENARDWIDYLELLDYYGKDLQNAKYVCPADLKAEHQRYVTKKRLENERRLRQEREQQRRTELKKAKFDDNKYVKAKGMYFGLLFTEGDISIRVLNSLQDFKHEGNAHGHCVHTNAYYFKKDTLCLSATVNGVRMETVEVSLNTGKVLQARGAGNDPTPYHNKIVALMNKNIKKIMAIRTESKKSKEVKSTLKVAV